ncbi:ATP-binding protein [Candidatus Saccharibacteria bacterium]|nr:ATP-binding protein [Candidatus Saccharibacteria bacterium]
MIKRESYLQTLRNLKDIHLIKVATGIRRSGKSTILTQFREELEANGEKTIFYNLEAKENERFTKDSDLLYNQIVSELDNARQNYIFIDEVQMVPEFERMLSSLFIRPNIDLYVTGSNAYMLSSDIATLLTGRYIELGVQPLTFSEFAQFFSSSDRTRLFQTYLKSGGFPEVANMLSSSASAETTLYLQNVYQTILEKDIKKRKQIRSMDDFRRVYLYCLDNIGNSTSANNIAHVLNSNGQSIDRKTVDEYLGAMRDCFLLYRADRYDIRGKNILRTGEKYYSVDLGFADALLGRPSSASVGHRLENIVYLELKKRYRDVWIGKNYDKEIDFVIKNTDGEVEYYQVTQTLASEETRKRELSAIENTGDYYRRTILTMDLAETSEKGIRCRNLVDWLTGI